MRIVYLHQYFNTPQMPGGTRSYEMARRLVAAGHSVEMVTSDTRPQSAESGRGWRVTDEAGIRVHWYPVPYTNAMGRLARMQAFARFAWQSTRKAMSLPADVIFATSTPLTIAIPALAAKWWQKCPMVFEVRDLWPEVPIAMGAITNPLLISAARWLERTAYRHSAEVVALSPEMRAGVLRQGVDPQRVAMIPNSSDIDLFDVPSRVGDEFRGHFEWLGGRPLVIYTGTLGAANGVDYLVRVAAQARSIDADVRFLIVGQGKEAESLQHLARELGVLNENVFFLPPLKKADMPAILSAADLATSLFLNIPELQANSPNKLFDALAAGRPVAINNGGWMGELIRERKFGLDLPPLDHAAAARQIVNALRDPEWCRRARLAARTAARELFDRDLLARQLEDVLRRAAGQPLHAAITSKAA